MLSISQRELAELAGVGINTLTSIEIGRGNPSLDVLEKILNTLGLEIEIKTKDSGAAKVPYYVKPKRALYIKQAKPKK